MAKDPAFPFYTNDFDSKTKFFTNEQVGMYLRLLMAQHQHGHLTKEQMTFICGRYDKDVFAKFQPDDDGLFFNDRLDAEIDKRKKYSESRKINRNSSKKNLKEESETTHDSTYVNHMSTHMDNDNEKDNGIKIKKESLSKNEIFEQLFTDQRFVTDLQITHKGKNINQAWNECYTHHSSGPSPPNELWEWKQKLNSWLTIKKPDNANSKTKREQNSNALKEAIANDIMREFGSG